LRLRAQNLATFVQLAEGIDDETWSYHLRRGDYSEWIRGAIKDEELASEIVAFERDDAMTAAESRRAVIDAIGRRYTGPA
jgi:hypothetical protein